MLNKRSEVTTGWSDHGARWMAPETARWLSTDPPVAAPHDAFMSAPWALHPYQYVEQNPIAYWDPSGAEPEATHKATEPSSISIEGKDEQGVPHRGFQKFIVDKIDQFSVTRSGGNLYRSAYSAPHKITVVPSLFPIEGGAYTKKAGPYVPGKGGDAIIVVDVRLTDDRIQVYDSKQKLIPMPAFLVIAHELAHADHIARGTFAEGESKTKNYVGPFGKEEQNTIETGHPSENDIRKDLKMPLRSGHFGIDKNINEVPNPFDTP